jgi:hypothetical protein
MQCRSNQPPALRCDEKCVSGTALLCFAGGSLKPVQHTGLKLRSARLSITDHETNRVIEVTNDDVALQGQRRIKTKFWHCA